MIKTHIPTQIRETLSWITDILGYPIFTVLLLLFYYFTISPFTIFLLFIMLLFFSMKYILLSDDGFTVTYLYCLTVLWLYYYFAILIFTVIFTVLLLLFYCFMIWIETIIYYMSHIVCYILYYTLCVYLAYS